MGKGKKDGTKKKGEGRKAKAGPIPKTVAGLHVPKEWREAGARLIEAANSPVGREVIAAGLAVAATAAEAAAASKRAKGRSAAPHEQTGEAAKPKAPDIEAFTAAIGGVAQDILAKVFAGPRKS